jgi:hypothetical protein
MDAIRIMMAGELEIKKKWKHLACMKRFKIKILY